MKAEIQTHNSGDSSRSHLVGLQALRGICAILIIIHHFGFQNVATDAFGDIAVAIFFILSGFVLTHSYAPRVLSGTHPSFFHFIFHRLVTIYPLYIAAMIFMWYFEYRYTITRRIMLTQALLLQSFSSKPEYYLSANSPAWFVSDIIFCYLLFIPLLYLLRRPAIFRIFLCIIFSLYFLTLYLLPSSGIYHAVYINPLMQLPVFIIGMALAARFLSLSPARRKLLSSKARIILPLAILILIIQIYLSPYVDSRFSLASYWWPVCALLVYSLALIQSSPESPASISPDGQILNKRIDLINRQFANALHRLRILPILLFLGDISYPLFIFHFPYLHFTRRIFALNVIPLPPWLELSVALIFLSLLGTLLHHLSKGIKATVHTLTR